MTLTVISVQSQIVREVTIVGTKKSWILKVKIPLQIITETWDPEDKVIAHPLYSSINSLRSVVHGMGNISAEVKTPQNQSNNWTAFPYSLYDLTILEAYYDKMGLKWCGSFNFSGYCLRVQKIMIWSTFIIVNRGTINNIQTLIPDITVRNKLECWGRIAQVSTNATREDFLLI